MSDILFTIHGFNVRANTLYQVTEKIDTAAPEGYKSFKTSKILHPDISNSEPGAVFDRELGVWDTGLYENSKALTNAVPSSDERSVFVKNIKKVIVTPLQNLKGKDYLSNTIDTKTQNEFWDNYRVNIFKDKIFNSSKPEELLQLYLSILHKRVTPKPLESHPDFKNCQYCVIDKEDSVDRKLETEMGQMKAQGTFYNLLQSKKEDLLLILDYLRLSVSKGTEDKVLVSVFNNWLKDKTDGFQNYTMFLKTYDMLSTDDGEKELYYYSKIKELIKTGVVKQKKNEIWFEDEYIASDIKAAAKNIFLTKDLEERFLKHLE